MYIWCLGKVLFWIKLQHHCQNFKQVNSSCLPCLSDKNKNPFLKLNWKKIVTSFNWHASCFPKSAEGVWENAILIKRCCTLDNATLTFLPYYACHMWPLFSTWYKKSFAQKWQHHYQNYDNMDRLAWCLGKWCLGKSCCTTHTKWITLFNVMIS